MKKTILLLYGLLELAGAFGQNKSKPDENFYVFDQNWKSCPIEKGYYFIHSQKVNDSSWDFDTYYFSGPLLSCEHFRDDQGKILEGKASYFNKLGWRDSVGSYQKGLPEGTWYYFNDTGKAVIKKGYSRGQLLWTVDIIREDSIKALESKLQAARDSAAGIKRNEIESDYPGGVKAWINFLQKNLEYPDRAMKLDKEGTVWVEFLVDKEGRVQEPSIAKSVEYSLDSEALRIILRSKRWVPAQLDGKLVKSYKRQPIEFRLR